MPLNPHKILPERSNFHVRNRDKVSPYITRDGSQIWELFHPLVTPVLDVSLAEAFVKPAEETKAHQHDVSQEIYYILEGEGIMTLGSRKFDIRSGDAVLIPPGTVHKVKASDSGIRMLCICTPPYMHEDTELSQSID